MEALARIAPFRACLASLVLVFAAVLSLGGCASVDANMRSWLGHHQSDLIASWGPPHATAPDGAGGMVLVYYGYRDFGQNPGTYGGGRYTAPTERGWTTERMFYVNSDGIIYRYRWQGL